MRKNLFQLSVSANSIACIAGLAIFVLLFGSRLLAILEVNDGFFVYTLDDPYIHLALAENILRGHYGINLNEYSAPSSSILWPFFLAPFSWSPLSPLLLNFLFGIGLVLVFVRTTDFFTHGIEAQHIELFKAMLVCLLLICTNVIGLVFIGMEHTLQALLVALIAYGLLIENRTSGITWWLLVSIVIAPLVRYENMAISVAALFYLFDRGQRKQALMTGAITALFLVAFSLFLGMLDLGYLPTSVDAKLNPRGDLSSIPAIFLTLLLNHGERQGLVLFIGLFGLGFLLYRTRTGDHADKSTLLLATVVAVLLHFLFGKTNWYNRYEIYIWIFFLINVLNIVTPMVLTQLQSGALSPTRSMVTVVGLAGLLVYSSLPYLTSLASLPHASNNIFQQHYQMSRFANDFYRGPVAVNDIGYVAYQNDHYVLDLFGLASEQSLESRRSGAGAEWMDTMLKEENVELAMIYNQWFPQIPDSWVLLGQLEMAREPVTAEFGLVSFYATNSADLASIKAELSDFSKTLPNGVAFQFN